MDQTILGGRRARFSRPLAVLLALCLMTGLLSSLAMAQAATPPTITTASLPGGYVGVAYHFALSADGDTPIIWHASGLPSGFSMSRDGVLTGKPVGVGSFSIAVNATNSSGTTSTTLSLAVGGVPPKVTGGVSTSYSTPVLVERVKDRTTASATINARVDAQLSAIATLPADAITDLADRAKAEARRSETVNKGVSAQLIFTTQGKDATSFTLSIPRIAIDRMISESLQELVLVTDAPALTITLNLALMRHLRTQANGEVILTVTPMTDHTSLDPAITAALGVRPAYTIALHHGTDSQITTLGSGLMTVKLPYTLARGELAANIKAFTLDEAGKIFFLSDSQYDATTQEIIFSPNLLPLCGVGYRLETPLFDDIDNHWGKDDILFVASHGLMRGMDSQGIFSPDAPMTRGMFVTTLGRLAGIDPLDYPTCDFTDVGAAVHYAPYVAWAAQMGIVRGTGAGIFLPDVAITRQEMAVMMVNHAALMDITLPTQGTAAAFLDQTDTASWAVDAVDAMQQAQLIGGRETGNFDPTGPTTRAETAAILHRYLTLMQG